MLYQNDFLNVNISTELIFLDFHCVITRTGSSYNLSQCANARYSNCQKIPSVLWHNDNPKILIQCLNVGAIQVTTYYETNLTKSPSQKSDTLDRFFWKSIPSMLLLFLTLYFPKFHVYPSANVGAILVTTYYETNLNKSPSQKSDPLDRFFWKSISSMLLLLRTTSQSFVYMRQQM
jgi:hypothetical protein